MSAPEAARQLVKGMRDIASLPSIYDELTQVINNPRGSVSDIGKIVAQDPSLTARLLRLVNSAFFGFPQKIETVSRAVAILGTLQLRDLALATSVVSLFKDIPQDTVDMNSFWRHSLACGVISRIIAKFNPQANPERAFVGGLLHDIGRLIIFLKAPDKAQHCLAEHKRTSRPLFHLENEILGFDHAQVGQALLIEWNLPASLQNAVGYHHHPERADGFNFDAALVHIADIITHVLCIGSSGETRVPPLHDWAWKELKIPPARIAPLLPDIEKQFQAAVRIILHNSDA